MRIVHTAIGIALVSTAWHALSRPHIAMAEGALAVGITENLREGSTYGFAYDMKTSEFARTVALRKCKGARSATARLKARCRVVASFKRQCVAVALAPKAPGFGWAIEPDLATAEERAIGACQREAGNKWGPCKVSESQCDTRETN
jgi:Domain of unknown function (DUF4189)